MKKYVLVGLILLLSVPAFTQRNDIHQRPERFERSRDYDVLHYRLRYRFDRAAKLYFGENTITLEPLKDRFEACRLDAESFKVTAVISPDGGPLEFEQTDRHLIVHFSRTYAYRERLSFTVRYRGGVQKVGLKFIDAGEDHPAQINTYGWPEANHHWFPCYDFPNDRVTNELIATVRSGDKVLSNGRLVSVREEEEAGTVTWHWSQEQPHAPYLITMTVGPYEIIEDRLGDLPVNYWVYKRDMPHARRSFAKTPEMIAFFNRIFGFDYPWAKYDQVTIAGWGGGFEVTSATILGDGTIHDERAEQDFSSHSLVAHELAHMWWGDLITERTWSHVWLSESFATYSEYLYQRYDKGEEEGAVNLLNKKNSYLREARDRYMRPMVFNRYNGPWDIMDAHAYPKGACILHMLRFVMGEDSFFRSLKHFLTEHAYQAVDTHDLQIAVKQATGQNLDWFFEQWISKPGHPVFDVAWEWAPDEKKVRLRVAQIQNTENGVPIHRTPVMIGIVTSEGRTTHRVFLETKVETFEFETPLRPLLVRFDEGNHLLKEWSFPKERDELLYQLEHDDVIGRMWAADQLGRLLGDGRVARALERSAREDAFWHVRLNALESLAGGDGPPGAAFLRDAALDPKSRVRAAALRILGELSPPDSVEYLKERFLGDDSYLVQAQALRSLGVCGGPEVIPFLKRAAAMDSPRRIIQRAAEAAVKAIEKK